MEYADYEVSNLGRVRRRTASFRDPAGTAIRPFAKKATNYLAVNIGNVGLRRSITVHEIVCSTFNGAAPAGHMVVCHRDGTKQNNAAGNLRWDTPRGNAADAMRHGHVARGAMHGKGQAKLSATKVARIKGLLLDGARTSVLARTFGVSENAISHIKYGRTWREVLPEPIRERKRLRS